MPLYEYECRKCHHRFEVIQKFSDPPRTRCPVCKGRVEKLLSPPAIQFKGDGWYVTDYGNKGTGAGEAKASGGSETKDKKPSSGESKGDGGSKGSDAGSD